MNGRCGGIFFGSIDYPIPSYFLYIWFSLFQNITCAGHFVSNLSSCNVKLQVKVQLKIDIKKYELLKEFKSLYAYGLYFAKI